MMTIHSAKGLEFPNVFIVGMEEGIFPGMQTILYEPENIEEERRLAYVAITRAKKKLYISSASTRMLYGMTNRNRPSRFVEEIPEELLDKKGARPMSYQTHGIPQQRSAGQGSSSRGFQRFHLSHPQERRIQSRRSPLTASPLRPASPARARKSPPPRRRAIPSARRSSISLRHGRDTQYAENGERYHARNSFRKSRHKEDNGELRQARKSIKIIINPGQCI